MQLLNTLRAGGKTYKLVQWQTESPTSRVIVSESNSAGQQVSREYGLRYGRDVIGLPMLHNFLNGRPHYEVAFDDADALIYRLLQNYMHGQLANIAIIATSLPEFRPEPKTSEQHRALANILDHYYTTRK